MCTRLNVRKTTTKLHPAFFASTTVVIRVNPEEDALYMCNMFMCVCN